MCKEDPPRIVVYGEPGYYSTGRVGAQGQQYHEGGYFSSKREAVRHAKKLAAIYNLPVADETWR